MIMTKESKTAYLNELKERISLEMPKVMKEISIYENNLRKGKLTKDPKPAPQFNG